MALLFALPVCSPLLKHHQQCGALLADPTQIDQILMNLCTNAYHAMGEKGGVLRVELQMESLMLTKLGYRVTAEYRSSTALKIFQADPEQFDLVMTDMTMPEMTGAELAVKMLEIRPDIPIILCTGYSNLMSEKMAKTIGIKEFVFKPLLRKDVGKLIRKALDG